MKKRLKWWKWCKNEQIFLHMRTMKISAIHSTTTIRESFIRWSVMLTSTSELCEYCYIIHGKMANALKLDIQLRFEWGEFIRG